MIELVVNDDSPMLGHNSGPPLDTPEILPPSDARPSESDAKYWSAVNDHIDELMAVAEARAGTKKWGSSFQRTSLLGIAGDIEIARKLPKSEERELRKRPPSLDRARAKNTEGRARRRRSHFSCDGRPRTRRYC